METTTRRYGAGYSWSRQYDGIRAYVGGSDDSDTEKDRQAGLLFQEFLDEVDRRLPWWLLWMPAGGEFRYDVERVGELPSAEGMAELFEAAWAAVEARIKEIIG